MASGMVVFATMVTIAAALGGAALAAAGEDRPLTPGVTAHRGNSAAFPENTLPAFAAGLRLGADWLELDVRLSKDGELVVIHDADTRSVGDRNLVIAEHTYAELAQVDAATGFRARHQLSPAQCPPQRLPRLGEVLELVKQAGRGRVSLQPKADCVDQIVALVKRLQAEAWVGFNDGSLAKLRRARELLPQTPIFWDLGERPDLDEAIPTATAEGFTGLVVHQNGLTAAGVARIAAAGLEPGVWTVNEEKKMAELLAWGVRRFYTDEPERLIAVMTAAGAKEKSMVRRPEIIGHRGASHDAPENTLPAIELAWRQNADAVEIDIYLTRDGRIIAMHDETAKRYTGREWKPGEKTLAEWRELDFGAWKGPQFAGTRIAALPEILATVPAGKRLFIEIKCGAEIVEPLAQDLAASGLRPEAAAFICFSSPVLSALKKRLPAHQAYWLIGFKRKADGAWQPAPTETIAAAQTAGFEGLDVNVDGPYDAEFVQAARQAGLKLYAWTVNRPEDARHLAALGFDGLTSDRPQEIRAALTERE